MLQCKNNVLKSKGKGLYFRVKGQIYCFKCSLAVLLHNFQTLAPECFPAGQAGWDDCESLQVGSRSCSRPSVQRRVCRKKNAARYGITQVFLQLCARGTSGRSPGRGGAGWQGQQTQLWPCLVGPAWSCCAPAGGVTPVVLPLSNSSIKAAMS